MDIGHHLRAGLVGAGVLGAAALLPAAAAAQWTKAEDLPAGEFTGALSLASDYAFRGISQTRERPAVQGTLEYAVGIGPVTPYAGVFGSNVSFPDGAGGTVDGQSLEVDLMAGVRWELLGIKWDAGFIRYWYPGTTKTINNPSWNEWALRGSYDAGFATVLAGVYYAPRFSAASDEAVYYQAGIDVPLPFEFTLSGRIGHQTVDKNFNFGFPDYTDWNIGVARDLFGFTLSLTYYDTDIKRGEDLGNGATINDDAYELTRPRVIFAVTKKF